MPPFRLCLMQRRGYDSLTPRTISVRGVSGYSSVFSVPSVMAGVSSGASRDFFSALT